MRRTEIALKSSVVDKEGTNLDFLPSATCAKAGGPYQTWRLSVESRQAVEFSNLNVDLCVPLHRCSFHITRFSDLLSGETRSGMPQKVEVHEQ